jgi:hypothetical protein
MLFSRMKKNRDSLDVGPMADLKAFFANSSHSWKFAAVALAIPLFIGAVFMTERHKIPYRPPDLTYVRMEAGPGEDDKEIRAFHDAQAAELAALQAKAEKQKEDNKAAAKRIDDTLKSWHLK